ncbi:hypothetical protein SSCG_06158 [Streptomyces clavuligerus]|nr:hypothetical protein SSCG_06158 [Streptomyces clavuligerus]
MSASLLACSSAPRSANAPRTTEEPRATPGPGPGRPSPTLGRGLIGVRC